MRCGQCCEYKVIICLKYNRNYPFVTILSPYGSVSLFFVIIIIIIMRTFWIRQFLFRLYSCCLFPDQCVSLDGCCDATCLEESHPFYVILPFIFISNFVINFKYLNSFPISSILCLSILLHFFEIE